MLINANPAQCNSWLTVEANSYEGTTCSCQMGNLGSDLHDIERILVGDQKILYHIDTGSRGKDERKNGHVT